VKVNLITYVSFVGKSLGRIVGATSKRSTRGCCRSSGNAETTGVNAGVADVVDVSKFAATGVDVDV